MVKPLVALLALSRITHESTAATADMTVLLSELEALQAGSRASSGAEPCDVPFRYASGPTPCGCPLAYNLHGLATAIHESSGLEVSVL